MHFGKRLAKVRNRISLTQADVGKWEKKSKQAIANREAKENPAMGLTAVAQLLAETNTDARYLFGQTDDIGLADLRVADAPRAFEEILADYKALKEREEEKADNLTLGDRVNHDDALANIVRRLLRHRDQFLRIEGWLDVLDAPSQREPAANGQAI